MLKLFTKTMPWMVASLIVATSAFAKPQSVAQCPPKPTCPQPNPPTQVCPGDPCCPSWPTPVLNAAYNYPARIQTRCPWDIYADASFIYWQPTQENMEIGFANTTPIAALSSVNGSFVNMDFKFKPGFKVGLGGNFDYDNWDMHLEYTWLHCHQTASATAPTGGQIVSTWAIADDITAILSDSVSSNWKLKMDILQLDLGRWNYVGTKLTFHPYFGARAAWIRQHATLQEVTNGTLGVGAANETTIRANSLSWAIGPEVGFDSKWNLGAGFRFYGDVEGDILFTRYTKANFSQTQASGFFPYATRQTNLDYLRAHVDIELGFGWGTYVDCNNWYLDFSAGYGFQVFFDQNMLRGAPNATDSMAPQGNLYVQGLTATFQLDF